MSSDKNSSRDPYLVKSVVHSAQLLSAFRSSGEALPLREVAARSGLPKSMAFRLLYTLERCGMIEKVGENLYRSHLRPFKQRPYRLGYAAQGTDYQFSKEISAGLQRAAAAQGIELICVDNRYSPKIAQRNADVLVAVVTALGETGYSASVPYLAKVYQGQDYPAAARNAAASAMMRMGVANPQTVNEAGNGGWLFCH